MRLFVFLTLFTIGSPCSWAADQLSMMVDNYFALRDVPPWTASSTYEEAVRVQDAFVDSLIPKLGKPVGFKVGLVTKEAQDRFNISHPVRGRLLSKMLLPNDSTVPLQYGVRPVCEADLIVVVKDAAINRAENLTQALHSLKEVVAFIELADSFVATNPPVTAVALTAANVGARLGVLGERLTLKTNPEFLNALAQMRVNVRDDSGADLGEGQGNAILSHPLNAVLWLVEDLKQSGQKLRAGDLLSLGSIKAFTPKAGQRVTVTYQGLPRGSIKASVRFQ
ncbi:MAG TPA: hydratase [Verrucomicrobiae bacterium]|nr:hydratase [Verrucomicrobiae bacterium]